VEGEGESSRPADAANQLTQVLGLPEPQDGVQDLHSISGHGESIGHTGGQKVMWDTRTCPTRGGAGHIRRYSASPTMSQLRTPIIAEQA
jgi:hypothetical protein